MKVDGNYSFFPLRFLSRDILVERMISMIECTMTDCRE